MELLSIEAQNGATIDTQEHPLACGLSENFQFATAPESYNMVRELQTVEYLVEMPSKRTTPQSSPINLNAKVPAWIQASGVVLLASIGFAFWCGRLASDIGHLQTDVARIEGRINGIESSLLALRAAQSKKALQEIAKLKPEQFSSALPAIRAITEQPVAAVALEPTTLREVAVKLSMVNQTTPAYWITALNYIQWASSGMSSESGAPPSGTRPMQFDEGKFLLGNSFSGLAVILDGAHLQDDIFDHCRVIFTGKPTRLQNVTFINCVFEFPITDSPSAPLKVMGEQLLADGIQRAVVSLL